MGCSLLTPDVNDALRNMQPYPHIHLTEMQGLTEFTE